MAKRRLLADGLPTSVLDILPNPVFVKEDQARYVWVNAAFEELFGINRKDIIGQLDQDLFSDLQMSLFNGGDLRVLDTRAMEEARAAIVTHNGQLRETVTRKSRLILDDGTKLLVGVMHDITEVTEINRQLELTGVELQRKAAALKKLSETDALTGCHNRRALFDEVGVFSQANWVGIGLFDLDHFKSINDAHGHDAGDETLKRFVACAQSSIRKCDILARIGGEEFAIALPNVTSERLQNIVEEIRRNWAATKVDLRGGVTITSTVSAGAIHCICDERFDLSRSIAMADKLLYQAKKRGRNCTVISVQPFESDTEVMSDL